MIDFHCPTCRTPYQCPPEQSGVGFACEVCQAPVRVPAVPLDIPDDEVPARAAHTPGVPPRSDLASPAARPPAGPPPGWYYERADEVVGPVSERQLRAAAGEALTADARVWAAGMADWQPAHEALPQLFSPPARPWGAQGVLAVVLATVAFASLTALGGVYAYTATKSPEVRPGQGQVGPVTEDEEKRKAEQEERRKAEEEEKRKADERQRQERLAKPLTGEEAGPLLLRSTVWIYRTDAGGRSSGSGVLVHRERRLVLTNYHVVTANAEVQAFFPDYEKNGSDPVLRPAHYVNGRKGLSIRGKVAARDPKLDLAVVELDTVPLAAVALPLSRTPARRGEEVFSLGASGVDLRDLTGSLWRQTRGTVTNTAAPQEFAFRTGQKVDARFFETDKPVNPGDSGGPTINKYGLLIGVVSAGDPKKLQVKYDIDVEEVRAFLRDKFKDLNWDGQEYGNAVPAGPKAPTLDELIAKALKAGDTDARVKALNELVALGPAARPAVPKLLALLDDDAEPVRRGTADALEKIGPPAASDVGEVVKALSGEGPGGRLYALRYFAGHKAEREQLPALVKALAAGHPEERKAALAAVAHYGPDSKPAALDKLLELLLDTDPAVARQAGEVVLSFRPFDGRDRSVLVDNLTHPKGPLRELSVRLVVSAKLAPNEQVAVEWLRLRLRDAEKDPAVRLAAAEEVAKLGRAARAAAPELLERAADDADLNVRVKAAEALGALGGGPKVVPGLGRLLTADPPRLRAAALAALQEVEYTDPDVDLPVLEKLAAEPAATVRAFALDRAAGLLTKAKALPPWADRAVDDPDPRACAAALRAAAVVAPALVEAAEKGGLADKRAVEALSKRAAALVGKPFGAKLMSPPGPAAAGDGVTKAALDVLVKLDKAGADRFAELLISTKDQRALQDQVIERVGEIGPLLTRKGADELVAVAEARIMERAGKQADEAKLAALARSFADGPIGKALAGCANDHVAAALREKYKWKLVNMVRVSEKSRGAVIDLWVLYVLAELPPAKLSEAECLKAREWMENHGLAERDKDYLRPAAQKALTRLGGPVPKKK